MANVHAVLALVAGRRCAVPFDRLVEVIPAVDTQPALQAPGWMRGWINFRGHLIPCLDLSDLLGTGPCQPRMANRILVVTAKAGGQSRDLAGVLVEAVVGHDPLPCASGTAESDTDGAADRLLGPIVVSADGPVQWIEPARLLQLLAREGVSRT